MDDVSLQWTALDREGPRPSRLWNLGRAIGAVALMGVFVGAAIVRSWFGARGDVLFTGVLRRYAQVTLAFLGVKVEVEGALPDGPHLLMANHGSLLDVFLFGALCDRPTTFVVKQQMGRIPFIGTMLERGGHVLLDRANAVKAMRALNGLARTLRGGGRALIFPEGTRHPDGVLGPFRTGAFIAAARAKVPVVPIAVLGAAALCPKNPFDFRPGTVRIRILAPIDTSAWSDDTAEAHAAEVRAALVGPLAAYRAERRLGRRP